MSNRYARRVSDTLKERLGFMQLGNEGRQYLRLTKEIVEQNISAALDRFYEAAQRTPQTAQMFANNAMMQRAKASQACAFVRRGDFSPDRVSSSTGDLESCARKTDHGCTGALPLDSALDDRLCA